MNVVPIETVVDIRDMSIRWADMLPYNGYQISTTGLVRSMKFYKKYPYGILITPDKNGNIKISNSLNQVTQVNIKDELNKARVWCYHTYDTYTRSRNPLITSQSKIVIGRIKNARKVKEELQKPSGFHFKTID